ncbi:MAG: 4Fe-4S dicluster domain-containing protein [Dehalococcoidia bacterium]|jgi:Fe-S-cluster-containing hydrogenase component 2|nr:4Fe-4S dicluster domain-containing protein [Dehalococcoidia bacterium]MDP7240082.1 4Fe-4S dicluster domain-containing protein [Dehalococcoidia bacterium]MDP7470273.1 4Fe-4S dicluster domain-containing protein [Dehalococcoidia bacterium]
MGQMLIVDPARCTGCRSCETACSTFREGESSLYKCRVKVVRFPEELFFYPVVCQQCETPLCAVPCPTNALQKDNQTGLVELIRDRCVGCKMCVTACPFGAITLVDGYPIKCDLCDGEPACTRLCEPGAITLGDDERMGQTQRLLLAGKVREAYLAK